MFDPLQRIAEHHTESHRPCDTESPSCPPKGLAELLAGLDCSKCETMAILGHSEAKTSEVYTRRVGRWKLALTAMERVNVSSAWV